MNKAIFGIACMAIALVAPGAFAQSNDKVKSKTKAKTEKVCKAKACSLSTECQQPCSFDGLNLTDSQKEQLKAAKEEYKTSKKALYSNAKETAKEQRDSVKAELRTKCKELKKAHLNKIKTILTADQYVVFLENNYLNAPAERQGMKQGKHGKGPKEGMKAKGQKGQRGDRPDSENGPKAK